jgi:hypothetical protein
VDGLHQTLEDIEALEEEGKGAYTDLLDLARNAIVDSLQK